MKTYLLKPNVRQAIAKAGETGVEVAYNAAEWINDYPSGVPQLMVTRPNGQRVPVTVTVTVTDNLIAGQVPDELLVNPGMYSYVFAWTSGATQLTSGKCECIVLGSDLAKTWADVKRAPDWAERIFLAAGVIESSFDGAVAIRNEIMDALHGAEDAQVAAEAAQDAAEDAKGAAEDAQAAAEAVKDSIPEEYSELSSDVVDLKSAFEHNTRLLYAKQVSPTFEPGGINNSHGGNVDSNQYIRTNYLRCAYGLQITVVEGYKARVAKYLVDGGKAGFLGWLDGEEWAGTHYYPGPDSYRYRIRIRKDPITNDIVPADGTDNVTITVYRTDETLSIALAPADAEKTGQEISKRLNIAEGTEIASGDDLNDYTTPGRYFSHDTSITSSLTNCPITNTGFVMTVEKCSTANYYQQTIRVNSGLENEEYHRIKTTNWSRWFKTVDTLDLMNPSTQEPVLSALKTHSLTGKKTITMATYNVKHYLIALSSDTASGIYNKPDGIMNYRKFLMNNEIDLLFLQECEDYIDNTRQINAFDYLYKYFFIADHNTDSEPFDRYVSSARRKILTRLPFNGQSTELTSVVKTGTSTNWNGYYSWCIAGLTDVGNILMINVHNFAHNYTAQENHRKALLDDLATLIGQQDGNYDYYIIAGDFNTITSTDYSNITSFANSINGTMVNGNMFGWFRTAVSSDRLTAYCLDNIIVSNNIAIEKVSCLPLWSYELFSDHVPVVAKLTFTDASLSLTT